MPVLPSIAPFSDLHLLNSMNEKEEKENSEIKLSKSLSLIDDSF